MVGEPEQQDHQRDRQLIANYIMDRTGAIKIVERGGKHYVVVTDFDRMRQGVGMLLAELMRIKAEGDYDAVKALIDKYGVHFDPKLRDQVVARYKKLNLPTYFAGVNPMLTATEASPTPNVQMSYPRDPVKQYLLYGAMYDEDLRSVVKSEPKRPAPKQR